MLMFVIERIISNKDVVECDNPTFSQNQQKNAIFKEITSEFNSKFRIAKVVNAKSRFF